MLGDREPLYTLYGYVRVRSFQPLRTGELAGSRSNILNFCFLALERRASLRSQEKQALKIVRFQRHLPLTIQFYISCRITGIPPLQSDFSGLSSALKDDTNEPKKRKETRTKPTKMARKKSTLRMTRTTTHTLHAYVLRSR